MYCYLYTVFILYIYIIYAYLNFTCPIFDYNVFIFIEMCPPLLSDSLIIHCTLNGNYANCSNPSIPDTIAIPSCKESHTVPINEQEEIPIALHCQSNGTWSKRLYPCISCNFFIL